MANTSILAAFERMWQHVVAIVSNKSDKNHNHDESYLGREELDLTLSEEGKPADAAVVGTMISNLQEALGGYKIRVLSESEYTNLGTYDATTIYYCYKD
jgi:hypothetical protein